MKIGFLITARLKSTRLRKKLLLPLNGFTVIERVIQRAKQVINKDSIVLCTSKNNQDYPLINTAVRNDIYYFNGHPDDVLQRLLDAAVFFDFDYFIGITADNPLFSIHHCNVIKDIFINDPSLDYVFTSNMPIGINPYGINVNALKTVCAIKKQIDTEIWSPLIDRPEIFNVKKVTAKQGYIRENYRLTLDEENDYQVFNAIYDSFKTTEVIDVLKAYEFLDNNPAIHKINKSVIQRSLSKSVLSKIDNYYNKEKSAILRIKKEIYNK